MLFCTEWFHMIQLSPEGEVNSGGIARSEASTYISSTVHRPEISRNETPSQLRFQNSQGYSELQEPIKTRENCYSLTW